MHTVPLFRNRISRFLPPVTAFWQPPVDERYLWFVLGVLAGQAGYMVAMFMRAVRVIP